MLWFFKLNKIESIFFQYASISSYGFVPLHYFYSPYPSHLISTVVFDRIYFIQIDLSNWVFITSLGISLYDEFRFKSKQTQTRRRVMEQTKLNTTNLFWLFSSFVFFEEGEIPMWNFRKIVRRDFWELCSNFSIVVYISDICDSSHTLY